MTTGEADLVFKSTAKRLQRVLLGLLFFVVVSQRATFTARVRKSLNFGRCFLRLRHVSTFLFIYRSSVQNVERKRRNENPGR